MNQDTLVVGDIHGDVEAVRKALSFEGGVVFIGDYLDSFEYSVEDQITCLTLVLDACEKEPERVRAIPGNHERSYLFDHERCSGWKASTYAHVTHLAPRMHKLLQPYVWVRDFLCTHAGISHMLLTFNKISYQEYLELERFEGVGRARGGVGACGGLYWCDWWKEFEPVPHLKQIVGHSSYRPYNEKPGIVQKGWGHSESYNIDCLMRVYEGLVIDKDGKATITPLPSL